MKSTRPAILFVLLFLGYLMYLTQSSALLPDRMATHFGAGGQPNGWMHRSGYVAFMSVFGLGLPLFVLLICYLSRFMPVWMVNIPNREFWLTGERGAQSYDYLLHQSIWLACMFVGFIAGIHYVTILANRTVPTHLPGVPMLALTGTFLAAVGVWTVALYRHFRMPA